LTLLVGLMWLGLIVTSLIIASVPVSLEAHVAVMVPALLAMVLLKMVKATGFWRTLFIVIGSFVVIRYVLWRAFYSIPSIDDPLSFGIAIAVFAAEIYAVMMFFISTFVLADPVERPPPPSIDSLESVPTVDIFIPTYNEDAEMLAITVAAATQLDYPKDKLRVYLLDDGGTDQRINHDDARIAERAIERRADLTALCQELGATYLTRARNVHAKAGNLSNGLENTDGELVVVFDADHVPTQDFLERTVGYFRQHERLFLVQTPHFFINGDPIERNLGLYNKVPGENEMFYSLIQRGLDKWNGTFFCGSGAVLRRSALLEAGGFSGDSITEDAETALELHSRGWESLYVNRPMLAGLQPETFAAFIGQRTRWAQGMMQILLLKNPLFKRGLSFKQRICYLNSSGFWLFPMARMMFIIAPLFYLLFGLEIFRATAEEFAAYTLLYMVGVFLFSNFFFRNVRWPMMSELYEAAQAGYLFRALVSVILKPRAPSFNVTAKDETLDHDFISPIWKTLAVLLGFTFIGLAATIFRYVEFPGDRQVVMVVGAWNVFNMIILMVAAGVICERQQRRSRPRVALKRRAVFHGAHGEQPASIEDGSMGGVQLRIPLSDAAKAPKPGDRVRIHTEDQLHRPLEPIPVIVRNVRADEGSYVVGVEFKAGREGAAIKAIARLIFGDSEAWVRLRAHRNRGPGVIVGLIRFVLLAFTTFSTLLRFVFTVRKPKPPAAKPVQTSRESNVSKLTPQPAPGGTAGGTVGNTVSGTGAGR